jgi:hypothetical protein
MWGYRVFTTDAAQGAWLPTCGWSPQFAINVMHVRRIVLRARIIWSAISWLEESYGDPLQHFELTGGQGLGIEDC